MKISSRIALSSIVALLGASASGQVIHEATMDDGDLQGWHVNGNQLTFFDFETSEYIGIPLGDFWGVTLSNSEATPLIGDLTRHGGDLELSVDIRVYTLNNFFEQPMDPSQWPIVLQITDTTQNNPGGPITVYHIGPGLPGQEDGWVRYTFRIPAPTAARLPDGWGGTGDEDPQTFEPVLPASHSYRSVLENTAEIKLTTFVPGYFYTFNYWEVGFDNVTVRIVESGGCPADWNGDEAVNSNDISAFLASWLASVQDGTLAADFNADGAVNSNDISAFLSAWLDAVQGGC